MMGGDPWVERGDDSASRAPRVASLDHQMAFDLVSARLARLDPGDQPSLVVASSPTLVQEALMRLPGPLDIAVEGTRVLDSARALIEAGSLWQTEDVHVIHADDVAARPPGSYRGIVWAWPHPSSWRRRLPALQTAISDGGLLAILTSGMLGAILSPLRRRSAADEPRWLRADLRGELARLGFWPERSYGFCRLECATYALMHQVGSVIQRPDLADRAEAAYRQSLLDSRGPGPAAFNLLTVRKVGHGG